MIPGKGKGDEVTDLERDFNRMAERIQKLMTAQKQLVRDISHELRSPLARLGVALGLARRASTATVKAAAPASALPSRNGPYSFTAVRSWRETSQAEGWNWR